MMGFIHVAAAVLSLLSAGHVGHSAPVTNCETLTQTIEITGREQLLGKWTHLAESTTITGSSRLTKMFVDTLQAKLTAANESDAIIVFQAQKMFGRCYTLTSKMTLENSTLSMVKPVIAAEVLLSTSCPDCLVVSSTYTIGGNKYMGLQLLSRRNKVTAAEVEEFTKQVECLNLPPAAFLDSEKGLCPVESSSSQDTETIDLTSALNNIDFGILSMLDKMLSSKDGMESLLSVFSSSMGGN